MWWKRPPCFIDLHHNAREWALHWFMFCAYVFLNAHLFDTIFIVAVVAVVAMTFFVNPNFIDIFLIGHHAEPGGSIASLRSVATW